MCVETLNPMLFWSGSTPKSFVAAKCLTNSSDSDCSLSRSSRRTAEILGHAPTCHPYPYPYP